MAYSKELLDHYENPKNVGSLDKASEDVGTGLVGAPACGDVMKLQIKVNDAGIIEDAKFKTFGCGSAIASSSLVTEWVKGKKLTRLILLKILKLLHTLHFLLLKYSALSWQKMQLKRRLKTTRKKIKNDNPYR